MEQTTPLDTTQRASLKRRGEPGWTARGLRQKRVTQPGTTVCTSAQPLTNHRTEQEHEVWIDQCPGV